jgi:hypothetical protein
MLECYEEELKVLILLDHLNSDLGRMVGILCDVRMLSDEMNFQKTW